MTSAPIPGALFLAALFAGCSGTGLPAPAVTPASSPPHRDSAVVSGGADGLFGELLLAADFGAAGPRQGVADDELARNLDAAALDHLRSEVLGGDAGPPLLGSALVRRLAVMPGAPRDQDGDGSNLDETLRQECERVVAFAGAALPAGAELPLLPWLMRSPDLAADLPGGAEPAPSSWRTLDLGQHRVRMQHLGAWLRARAIAAQRLLLRGRPGRLGATADEGMLGLLAVQQLQAAEATLFASMFTSGGPLGALDDPRQYDPAAAPRWLPAEVQVDVGVAAALTFRATDAASDLEALAALAEAGAMFAVLTRSDGPPSLAALFQGQPFKLPPSSAPPQPTLSWSREIGPLLLFRCGGCHSGVGEGGFVIDSYQQLQQGGNRTRALNLPMVVPGDHAASFLHEVLTGPRAPFRQMPLGSPLPAAEIAQIDAWIDSGARQDPPAPPAPPQPGEDLARVAFVDLVALHLDVATGALHHRHEADGGSGIATAGATGRALLALAALDRALPELDYQGQTPHSVLAQVAGFAAAQLLEGSGQGLDAVSFPVATSSRPADLQAQAALTAGMLAAAVQLPQYAGIAELAAAQLLTVYRDRASGLFRNNVGGRPQRYDDGTLELLLRALRLAAVANVADAAAARDLLLRGLLPVLAFAEWQGHGEVLGDGIADTDGDGIAEPAAAGGAHGRLPLLAATIVIDDAPLAPGPITWSGHVRPLLLQKCGECHLGGNQRGDYRLDTWRLLATPGESRGAVPLLVPGDADASFLLQKLTQRRPQLGDAMPLQRPPLDQKAIAIVRQWIEAGATSR